MIVDVATFEAALGSGLNIKCRRKITSPYLAPSSLS